MVKLYEYVKDYSLQINIRDFLLCTLFTGLLIAANYYFKIDYHIRSHPEGLMRVFYYSVLFIFVFTGSHLYLLSSKKRLPKNVFYYWLLILPPVIFACKMGITGAVNTAVNAFHFPDGRYWAIVLYWPVRGAIVFLLLLFLWKAGRFGKPAMGLSFKSISLQWYFKLLLVMLPFLLIASFGSDFQHSYPRMKAVFFVNEISSIPWFFYLLFEICYGTDFFTIEVFFRGFLVLAFVRYAGVNAILPMAIFYCSIHFGKPLAECISSYFGGILLGIIVYRQQSVWGGIVIHLGIAWAMEVFSIIPIGN